MNRHPRRLSAATLELLRRRLPEVEALAFAEAVTLQISHAPGAAGGGAQEEHAAERVLGLLTAVGRPEGAPRLAADPELLASVFQNIDLLFAHSSSAADPLALVVMEALEIADRSA